MVLSKMYSRQEKEIRISTIKSRFINVDNLSSCKNVLSKMHFQVMRVEEIFVEVVIMILPKKYVIF